jgi:hypothetical protein
MGEFVRAVRGGINPWTVCPVGRLSLSQPIKWGRFMRKCHQLRKNLIFLLNVMDNSYLPS